MVELTKRKILEILFVIVDWLAWIALIIGAIRFVNGVYFEYKTESTSIKMGRTKMKEIENPTITLCFQPYAKYSELNSLNISYLDFLDSKVPFKNLGMNWPEFYSRVTYQIGKDFRIFMYMNHGSYLLKYLFINKTTLTEPYSDYVDFEKIYTLFAGPCYKITPKIKTSSGLQTIIILQFDESVPKLDIPRRIEMFLTSEENSYGAISSQWNAGDVFRLDIKPSKKYTYKLQLAVEKHEKLKWTSNCNDDGSYISRLSSRFIKSMNVTNSITCLPINYKSLIDQSKYNSLEICHDNYMQVWANDQRRMINATRNTAKPCVTHQYVGNLMTFYGHMPNYKHIQVEYAFKSDKLIVHQEYLVIDDIQLIGTVGGTMGLFIGFSFLDVLQKCMTKFKKYLLSNLSE